MARNLFSTISADAQDDPEALQRAVGPRLRVLACNDLGRHGYDSSYAMLSFLPPFNVLRVVRRRRTGVALLE